MRCINENIKIGLNARAGKSETKPARCAAFLPSNFKKKMVGDLGIEPSVRLREGVTAPCHTLRPVAHFTDARKRQSLCLVCGVRGGVKR